MFHEEGADQKLKLDKQYCEYLNPFIKLEHQLIKIKPFFNPITFLTLSTPLFIQENPDILLLWLQGVP